MKKIAVLWSSPNENGLTASAKNEIISGMKEKEAEIIEIQLNKYKLNHCISCKDGWGTCRSEGVCALKDDFKEIYDIIKMCDGIVFVSAVYWSELTEVFKAFMDRLRRMEATHNHYLKDKRCMLIACAGGTGRGTIECLEMMERALTHMGMRAFDRIPVNRFNKTYMLPALKNAGNRYIECLTDGFDMYY